MPAGPGGLFGGPGQGGGATMSPMNMPTMPSGGGMPHQSPFVASPLGGQGGPMGQTGPMGHAHGNPSEFGAPAMGHGGLPHNPVGGGAAQSPNLWANSGTLDPHQFGKPPTQGGYGVSSIIPANLRNKSPFAGGAA